MDELFGPLSAFDAFFLSLERARTPMHLGAVGIIEPGVLRAEDGSVDLARLRRHVDRRFAGIPKMHRRVATGFHPFAAPRWVLDQSFDVERHVRLATVPPPGDREAFLRTVGELMARPLDVGQPLWELWALDGLADGRIGLLEKLHHALADGLAGIGTAAVLFDVDPDAGTGADGDERVRGRASAGAPGTPGEVPGEAPGEVGPDGGAGVRVYRTVRSAVSSVVGSAMIPLVGSAVGTARSLAGDARAAVELALHPQDILARVDRVLAVDAPELARRSVRDAAGLAGLLAPGVRSSGMVRARTAPKRRVAVVTRQLSEVHDAARLHGATVNEAVLAAVGSGIGDLVAGRGIDVADRRVLILVPVGYGHETQAELGNNVAALRVAVPIGGLDTLDRLDQVVDAVDAARRAHQTDGVDALLAALGPLMPWGGPAVAALIHHQPFVDVVVTNVPGPPVPLYLQGSRLTDLVPLMPLAGNLPLGVAVLSYVDTLNLGVIADPDAVPDLDRFAAGIAGFLDELVALG